MNNANIPTEAINKLAEILKEQDLTELELELENWGKIKVRKENPNFMVSNPPPLNSANPVAPTDVVKNTVAVASSSNTFEVKSPMVGTYYASPSPDAEPFIKVGDKVKKGDTLCIVEAMKLMNDLPADVSGTVTEICVDNAQAISFGEVLIKLEKDG